jgi:4-hydroxy-3-polyprenylbenzoate decarboxylase
LSGPTSHGPRLDDGVRPWVVGVTGASGTPYAATLIRAMLAAGERVELIVSKAARLTILDETGIALRDGHWRTDVAQWIEADVEGIRYWSPTNMAAGPASGSYRTKGMVVVPATTASVAGIATGTSKDLLQRAADVTLKERRTLVVVVRETPLRTPVLEHLASLSREGAVIMPASPAFYAGAADVQQLVDQLVGRVLDVCDVPHDLYRRWSGELGGARADALAGQRLAAELTDLPQNLSVGSEP